MEEEWELSKENIQPRREGRDVSSLVSKITPRNSSFSQKANEMQRMYEQAIRKNDSSDPLEVWYRYIIWTEHNSLDTVSSDVSKILERCIQHFDKDVRYKNDERYLKIWIKYADLIQEPLEVYNYMYDKGIGSSFTTLYESWADLLECAGNYQKADEVYQLGIARNAQPIVRLKGLYESFVQRLATKNRDDVNDSKQQDLVSRSSLAPLKKTKDGRVGHDRIKAKSGRSAGGLTLQSNEKQIQKHAITVFEDENRSSSSRLPIAKDEWKAPPVNSKLVKENAQKPGTWTSSKVSTANSVHAGRSTFMIHEDEDLHQKSDRTKQIVMSDRKPLSAKKVAKEERRANIYDTIKQKDDCQFVVRYRKTDVYLGNQEFSLEELRALEPKYAVKPISRDEYTTTYPVDMEETGILGTEIRQVNKSLAETYNGTVRINNLDAEKSCMNSANSDKHGVSRQRLDFSAPLKQEETKATTNESIKTKPQAPIEKVMSSCYTEELSGSNLDSFEDLDDFLACPADIAGPSEKDGPTESTSIHNASRMKSTIQQHFEQNVLKHGEITRPEEMYGDSYRGEIYPTESKAVPELFMQNKYCLVDKRGVLQRKDIDSTLASESSTKNPLGISTTISNSNTARLKESDLIQSRPSKEIRNPSPESMPINPPSDFCSNLQSYMEQGQTERKMACPNGELLPRDLLGRGTLDDLSTGNWIKTHGNVVRPKVHKPDLSTTKTGQLAKKMGNTVNMYKEELPSTKLVMQTGNGTHNFSIFQEGNNEKETQHKPCFSIFQEESPVKEIESKPGFSIFQDDSDTQNIQKQVVQKKMTFSVLHDEAENSEEDNDDDMDNIGFPIFQEKSAETKDNEKIEENKIKFSIFQDKDHPIAPKSEVRKNKLAFAIFQDEDKSISVKHVSKAKTESENHVSKTKFPTLEKEYETTTTDVEKETFKKPPVPQKKGLKVKMSSSPADYPESSESEEEQLLLKQMKRQPVQALTPASKGKRAHLYGSGQFQQFETKSPKWAPSPTLHTKLATEAIHEMWRGSNFTFNSSVEVSNAFEQESMQESMIAPQNCFPIREDGANHNDDRKETQENLKENAAQIFAQGKMERRKCCEKNDFPSTFTDSQQMSVSDGNFESSLWDQLASSTAAMTSSTPHFSAEPRPRLSCTAAIGNLHDSDVHQVEYTQKMDIQIEAKTLSPIQEQSGESLTGNSRTSSSSSRAFSDGGNSNTDAGCSTVHRPVQNVRSVFPNGQFSEEGQEAVSPEQFEQGSVDAPSETGHVEGALTALSLNTTAASASMSEQGILKRPADVSSMNFSNASISGRNKASKPVDVYATKAIAIVNSMDFNVYPNLKLEIPDVLNARFVVGSKIILGGDNYKIQKKIAVGGFATVFTAFSLNDDDKEEIVLKVMKSPELCQWEFYIAEQIHERIDENNIDLKFHDCLLRPSVGYVYTDAAVIQYPYHPGGTLLDLVNKHLKERVGQTDTFALLYGLNVCKIVKAMHDCSIIHGDVKPDNFLLNRLTENEENPCELNCLTLADFGSSLDLTLFSKTVTFVGSSNTDKFECIEMQQGKPWKYQIDYFGVACTIHVVLHGTYMDILCVNERWRPIKVTSRRQGREFWSSVFDRLLNISDCHDQTVLEGIIKDLEMQLADPQRRKAIAELLSFQASMMTS